MPEGAALGKFLSFVDSVKREFGVTRMVRKNAQRPTAFCAKGSKCRFCLHTPQKLPRFGPRRARPGPSFKLANPRVFPVLPFFWIRPLTIYVRISTNRAV